MDPGLDHGYWRQYRPQHWLLPSARDAQQPFCAGPAPRLYYAAGTRAGLPRKGGIHCLRHSCATHLLEAGVEITVLQRWKSPHTRADYPARWRVRVPSEQLELEAVPLLADQEMRTSFVYWEGAVSLSGTSRGRPVEGRGYVELTGYARSMQGVF